MPSAVPTGQHRIAIIGVILGVAVFALFDPSPVAMRPIA